jgi:hypothetical protein
LARFDFKSGIVLFCFVFLLSLFRLENRVYLSHGVQVVGAVWRVAMRIMAGVGDLVQRTDDGHICQVLGSPAIERLGGVVCGLHREWFDLKTTRTVFAGLNLKPVATVSISLASKPVVTGFSDLASKPVATVFSSLASKLVATVSPGLA